MWEFNMKMSRLLFLLIATLFAIGFSLWVWHQISIDRCLDNGGRWNSEISSCEGGER
jgi:hypothetical protein